MKGLCYFYSLLFSLVLLLFRIPIGYAQEPNENYQIATFSQEALHSIKINPALSDITIRNYINEVFTDQAEELIYSKPAIFVSITSFLKDRFFIIEKRREPNEKLQKLSHIALYDKYNQGLQRDVAINPYNFNPLKYQLGLFSLKKKVLRIDHSDYVIIILPVPI